MNKKKPSYFKTDFEDETRKLVLVIVSMAIIVIILFGFGPLI